MKDIYKIFKWISISLSLLFFLSGSIGCKKEKIITKTITETDTVTVTSNGGPLAYDGVKRLITSQAMVSSAHPVASEIGKEIMKQGGNAVDAAVAAAFAISVVQPEMSGLGGGGGMLIYMNGTKKATYIDHYSSKRIATYAGTSGNEGLMEFAIPGTVAGLLYAEEHFGKLTRQEVMAPAIKLAKDGFPMYLGLSFSINKYKSAIQSHAGSGLFAPGGEAFKVGEIFKQTKLASVLQDISDKGPSVFYEGYIADDIIQALNNAGVPVSTTDFRNYDIQTAKIPLTTTYKGFKVLSAPAPQGGQEIVEDLNLLEPLEFKEMGLPTESFEAFHKLTAVLRAGIADRKYNNDPNWVQDFSYVLASEGYATDRAASIFDLPIPYQREAGDIPGHRRVSGSFSDHIGKHTTSLTVVDPEGNAVGLTQTLSDTWGKNGVWVDGFFLNNSGTNANASFPYQRPAPLSEYRTRYSPVAPTIILNKDETVKMVIGSPGGTRISTATVQNILYVLDYGMDPMEAARMPRIFPNTDNNTVYIEGGFGEQVLSQARENKYYFARDYGYNASVYIIVRNDGQWVGASEPRGEGGVAGF